MIEDIRIDIITHSEDLPEMTCRSFFHSRDLFEILEKTRAQQPYMVVATKEGKVIAHLMAILRRRGSLIPPYLFSQGRIYGEGDYEEGVDKEHVFQLILSELTKLFKRKLCLYIEFSDLSTKMFGYKIFRKERYFPVQWMEVHNSLHSMPPIERLNDKMKERITHIQQQGVIFKQVEDREELKAFYRMLHRFFSLKVRRYLPPERLFFEMANNEHCRLFVTRYKEKVIGGCACIYYNNNAYLWYLASRKRRYPLQHPDTATIWGAIQYAYEQQFRHIYFMDVGLPFKNSQYREFILNFGGKEVSTYRWFKFTISCINSIIGWLYRE